MAKTTLKNSTLYCFGDTYIAYYFIHFKELWYWSYFLLI